MEVGELKKKDSAKNLEDICLEQDLAYIWRIRNLTERRLGGGKNLPSFRDG